MRVAFPSLLVAAMATTAVSFRGNFEDESMSADILDMISSSFSYGGIGKGKPKKSVGGGDASMSMGKSGKIFKGGDSSMSMGKSGKMFKSGKSTTPTEIKVLTEDEYDFALAPGTITPFTAGRYIFEYVNESANLHNLVIEVTEPEVRVLASTGEECSECTRSGPCLVAGWHETQYPLRASSRNAIFGGC
jgi:hypothetical protein